MDDKALDQFKGDVRAYVNVCNQLDDIGKQSSVLRKEKCDIEAKVKSSMKTFDVDQCQVSDGKVQIKSFKRMGVWKPKAIKETIEKFFESDQTRGAALLARLDETRHYEQGESVRYAKKRRVTNYDEDDCSVHEQE